MTLVYIQVSNMKHSVIRRKVIMSGKMFLFKHTISQKLVIKGEASKLT
jgi:hypothetical protein